MLQLLEVGYRVLQLLPQQILQRDVHILLHTGFFAFTLFHTTFESFLDQTHFEILLVEVGFQVGELATRQHDDASLVTAC
jgi:hypothetical protein